MSLRNRVTLLGRTGNDVEVFKFENGGTKASVSLATNDTYYNEQGERIDETQWHNVIAFGKQAEILEKFVVKGQEIALEGKVCYRNYQNAEGKKIYITEIRVSDVVLIS